jgi:hypothetical protein
MSLSFHFPSKEIIEFQSIFGSGMSLTFMHTDFGKYSPTVGIFHLLTGYFPTGGTQPKT